MEYYKDLKDTITELLNEPVTVSNTPWGTSLYFQYRGWKVRISDHTSDFRGFNEIAVKEVHFGSFDLDAINAKIDRFESIINATWTKKLVIMNIEAPSKGGVLQHFLRKPNATVKNVTQGEFSRKSKKGNALFNFVVEVEFSEKLK